MDTNHDTLIDRLRSAHLRVTQPRLAVFDCLLKSKKPLSAKELWGKLSKTKSMRDVDQVSVYRILETFKQLGLVHQVSDTGGYMACSHLTCKHGLHVIAHCTKCGIALEGEVSEGLAKQLKEKLYSELGFKMDNHYFQTSGLCSSCV